MEKGEDRTGIAPVERWYGNRKDDFESELVEFESGGVGGRILVN